MHLKFIIFQNFAMYFVDLKSVLLTKYIAKLLSSLVHLSFRSYSRDYDILYTVKNVGYKDQQHFLK